MNNMRVNLVAIAKNEDPYIEEWIEYNLKIGFDFIFLYLNDWEYTPTSDRVKAFQFNGHGVHLECYREFLRKHHKECEWAAFFDIDEFLVLKKHNNVKDFISDVDNRFNTKQIGINWAYFGDNGISDFPEGTEGVLERFTMRGKEGSLTVKSIVNVVEVSNNLPMIDSFVNTHYLYYDSITPSGGLVHGVYSIDPDLEIAQLNHYYCKTKKEFEIKIARGRSDLPTSSPGYYGNMDSFYDCNLNEVEDLMALNFFKS